MPSLHASCRAPVFPWIVFLLVCGTITGLRLWQSRIEHERLVIMMRLTALSRIPFPHRPPLWSEGEAVRRAVRTWGAWAWVAVLVAAGMSPDRRRSRMLAHVLLANAIVV